MVLFEFYNIILFLRYLTKRERKEKIGNIFAFSIVFILFVGIIGFIIFIIIILWMLFTGRIRIWG